MKLKNAPVLRKFEGFSLMEVLVFISILSLFFVAAITVTTFSLRSMKASEYKILASHLAEEGMEWVKSEKEADWNEFITKDTGAGTTYCLKYLNWNSAVPCTNYTLGTPAIFKRELTVDNQAGSPITTTDIEVTVSWTDGTTVFELPVKTVLKVWE